MMRIATYAATILTDVETSRTLIYNNRHTQSIGIIYMLFEINRTNTILYCRNWNEMVTFYQNILQLSVNYQKDWFVEFQLSENSYVSVADERKASIKGASGAGITLSWQVTDIKVAYDRLSAQKIAVSEPTRKWGSLVCYFKDPEGNRIEIWEALKK